MTVALVLATATACNRAQEAARDAAAGNHARVAGRALRGAPTRRADDGSAGKHGSVSVTGSGSVPAKGAESGQAAAADQLATALPLPSLVGGQVTTQPLLTRICSQLRALGLREIVLLAPVGRGDLLATMAWDGLSPHGSGLAGAGSVEVIECASVGAELRAAAAVTRRVSGSGASVLFCAGDLVGHTEALARLRRCTGTGALTDSQGALDAASGPDLRPALRLSGGQDWGGQDWRGQDWRGQDQHSSGQASGAQHVASRRGIPASPASRTRPRLHPRRAVVAAGSAFHRVHASDAVGCGAFLVSPGDGDELAAAADELAELAAGQPGSLIAQDAGAAADPAAGRGADYSRQRPSPAAGYSPGFTDSVALLLVGLVRSDADVEAVDVTPLVCMRVQTTQQAVQAAADLTAVDEDRVRLDAAVKPGGGPFASCLVSPYSRYIVRWAARRRLSPSAITGMSIGLGVLAAVWFSAGNRVGMILGAALLFAAFLLDHVDGQLARYLRSETAFGAWLDAVGGRLAEFAVYAGLAAGAVGSRSPGVWELAVAALVLQSLRDMIGFCIRPVITQLGLGERPRPPLGEPADYAVAAAAGARLGGGAGLNGRPPRRSRLAGLKWPARLTPMARLVRVAEFQQGERVAVIGVAAIVAGPRMTFIILLAWGLVAACLSVIAGIVRSAHPASPMTGGDQNLVTYRDDGVFAQLSGRFVDGQLPPLLPALVGVTVIIVLSAVGAAHLPGLMVLAPVVVMALAGLGSGHPHDGRLDWLVPPLIELGEYVFLTALALAGQVPMPLLFALFGVLALHHDDIVYRSARVAVAGAGDAPVGGGATSASAPQRWLAKAGLGWEGRMFVAAIGAVFGATVFAFAALAVYLWVLFGWESLTGWIAAAHHGPGDGRDGFRAVPRSADVEDGGSR